MKVEQHLDIKKVATRNLEEALRISKLQGQWTSANSLRHQAELFGDIPVHMMKQFDVHIKRVEKELIELGAVGEAPTTTKELSDEK